MSNDKTVLLTGASGLIGRQLVKPLMAAGFEVVSVSRSGRHAPDVKPIRANLLDPADIEAIFHRGKFTHLLHLAWHDNPRDRWTSSKNVSWAAASLELQRCFAKHGGIRAVGVGSCAEYDWTDDILSESSPLNPQSLYGISKLATSIAMKDDAINFGVRFAWARLFFCFGPGEPPGRLVGDLIHGMRLGQPVNCTDGLQIRDFLHTQDIATALTAILDSDVEGTINVGSGIGTPVKEIISEVGKCFDRPDLIRLGSIPRSPNDAAKIVADNSRLRRELQWAPQFSVADGIADIVVKTCNKDTDVETG